MIRWVLLFVRRSLAGISLLACLASAGLWVLSYRQAEWWERERYLRETREWQTWWVGTENGRVGIYLARSTIKPGVDVTHLFACCSNWLDLEAMPQCWKRLTDVNPVMPPAANWLEQLVYFRNESDAHREDESGLGVDSHVMAVVPYWVLCAVSALWPALGTAVWIKRTKKRRWAREGRCGNCGYDLVQTPRRCPECGQEGEDDYGRGAHATGLG